MAEKDDFNKKGLPIKPGGIPSKSSPIPPKVSGTVSKSGVTPQPEKKPSAPEPDVFDRNAAGFGAVKKAEPVYMAEHKVVEGETLSHIALKYYGSAIREKWMVIQEANQALIDEHKGVLLPGMVLKIPELPKK